MDHLIPRKCFLRTCQAADSILTAQWISVPMACFTFQSAHYATTVKNQIPKLHRLYKSIQKPGNEKYLHRDFAIPSDLISIRKPMKCGVPTMAAMQKATTGLRRKSIALNKAVIMAIRLHTENARL